MLPDLLVDGGERNAEGEPVVTAVTAVATVFSASQEVHREEKCGEKRAWQWCKEERRFLFTRKEKVRSLLKFATKGGIKGCSKGGPA